MSINSIAKTAVLLSLIMTTAVFVPANAEESQKGKSQASAKPAFPTFWPPREGYYYPNLTLTNYDGKPVSLASLRGKVLIFEPIGMTCPGCQAFAGAGKNGISGLGGVTPQAGLPSIEEMLVKEGISSSDPRIAIVQILLYNMSMQAPSVTDAQSWARNFKLAGKANRYVLAGSQSLIGNASYNMIPGFQLVDKGFVLRCDSTGHNPKRDLYRELIPLVKKLL